MYRLKLRATQRRGSARLKSRNEVESGRSTLAGCGSVFPHPARGRRKAGAMLLQYSRMRRPVLSAAEGNRRKFRTGASQVRLGVCELKQWQLEPANGCPPDADRRSFSI